MMRALKLDDGAMFLGDFLFPGEGGGGSSAPAWTSATRGSAPPSPGSRTRAAGPTSNRKL